MHKYLVAVSAGVLLLFGCSHDRSTVPQPIANIQPSKIYPVASPNNLPRHFSVLYAFKGGTDGANPWPGLIQDSAGNLYGAADGGDSSNDGVVFKVDPNGNETILHRFGGADGQGPIGGVIQDASGNLYGTTELGGSSDGGVVYKVDPSGNETVLHSFTGTDGKNPFAGVIQDGAGNLYGTTYRGGSSDCQFGCGVVFKLDTNGNETVLHSFRGPDGEWPWSALIQDAGGNLYGTTSTGGGKGGGVVFKVDSSGNETVLYSFGGADGLGPYDGLIEDAGGYLFGTTVYGGTKNKGVAFKLGPHGYEAVLHSFTERGGEYPFAGLVRSENGNLYGTAQTAGGPPPGGGGVVFVLDRSGNETVLHVFHGPDGEIPTGGLVRDGAGNLYGTTMGGGPGCGGNGCGVVYKLSQ